MFDKETRIIVLGHEKGGTGKSTIASHVAVGLLYRKSNCKIAVLDFDMRQGTTFNFFKNRMSFQLNSEQQIFFTGLVGSTNIDLNKATQENITNIDKLIQQYTGKVDYIIIDTPGSLNTFSSHSLYHANLLITPLNDSTIDINVLATLDPVNRRFLYKGPYVETVLEQKKKRLLENKKPFSWILVRNRISNIETENSEQCQQLLQEICKNLNCEVAYSIFERVVYRETFNKGLTIFDIPYLTKNLPLTKMNVYKEMNNFISIVIEKLVPTSKEAYCPQILKTY